jgi:hypothetical protein
MPFVYLVIAIVVVALVAWVVNRTPVPEPVRGIVNVMLGLIAIGMLLWLVNTYVPMAQSIKDLLNVVVFIACVVWVLQAFGLWPRTVALWNRMTRRRVEADHFEEPQHPETVPHP